MIDIINQGRIENNIYFLPDIKLDRKEYLEVAKHLEFLGGKWNRGKKGFTFDREIENIDALLKNSQEKTKKEIQFFPTPDNVCSILMKKCLYYAKITEKDIILEPSAGRGALIKALKKQYPLNKIDYCEINEINREYLNFENTNFLQDDFLTLNEDKKYKLIVANPPFSKNQDIDHIKKMYSLLENGGVLVSMSSKHWERAKDKKSVDFVNFLTEKKAEIISIYKDAFKESGTSVETNLLIIEKLEI